MILSLIAAIGINNELGKNNKLLWDLPGDMKHFRETTTGYSVVMGRKTFESIGRPLPNRRNIVITRDETYYYEGVKVVHSLDEALGLFSDSEEEVFCLGGGEIFKQAIDVAHRLYITRVESTFDADVFFPEIDKEKWKEISKEPHEKDERNPFPYTFILYEKKSA
jgi:dihydrofolate reductase